ncbi:AAA family ATPase [Clostridium sp. DSM 100503]|uniref:AAA family ATPase n=1 Tax=Clostridium sp. DSM 100503 TaxID=2963282 RepID=UPI00214A1875|nr:AAA family ATPase [Clostridium sp. DSM 100503]MCR1952320.1 AAA family ATPase [Clostridium sp. DSM 100503]
MKIRKLIITGFGPYAERQELDFEASLDGKNMFVITGNTGAGKTTIFDAINFALYGEASGSERDGKNLRSDFADKSTPTEVELWFSLRNKDYYIKRSPQYFRAKQRGDGFTESKPSAEIKIGDKTVSGPKEVTRLVEEILGITCEQFKQLVMIPQGEFKKLLNSDSDKKEEIFRKIFGTKVFSDIQQNIKSEANNLKKSIEQIQRDRENRIKAFSCKEDDEELRRNINAKDLNIELILSKFKDAIDKDEVEEDIIKENLKEINIEINNISKELVLANDINKKIDNLEKYKCDLEKLNLLKHEYEVKNVKLESGKKAVTALGFEDKYKEKKLSLLKAEESLRKSIENLEKYKKEFEDAERKLKIENEKEDIKNNLRKQLDEIEKLKEKASNYQSNKEKLDKINKESQYILERIKQIDLDRNNKNDLIKLLSEELENINKLKYEKSSLDIEEINYISKQEKLNKLLGALEKCKLESQRHVKGTAYYESADKEYNEKKNNYEKLEDAFRRNQAGILAKDLIEGENCPVCGSTHHPKLAVIEAESINEVTVKEAKALADKFYEKRESYYRELTKIQAEINSLKEETIKPIFIEIFNSENFKDDIEGAIEKTNFELKNNCSNLDKITNRKKEIEKVVSLESSKLKQKQEIEKYTEQLRVELENKNKELLAKEGELKTQEANLQNIVSEFKGTIRSLKELEEEQLKVNSTLEKLKEDYIKAEKDFNNIKTIYDKENGNRSSLEKVTENAKSELDDALNMFKEKVLELGFENYNDYSSSRMTEVEINALERDINKFNMDISNAQKVYNLSLEECKDLNKVDIRNIEETLETKNNEKINLEKTEKEIYLRISQNKRIIGECINYSKLIEADEEKYKTVGKLAKVINGDNPRKISFERYVLAAYFEDIIEAANIRFAQMTCNRFELLRKEELGDKRKGQGLDLEVFDNYTGKSRDVKTLSGGESFKASLSMALGLADVVQSYSGGIQLDTMFIDEGFGTLDPESLDSAIECLIDLQDDGRIVGVISHVQELKDRIETKLEVSSTNKGSKAVFKV